PDPTQSIGMRFLMQMVERVVDDPESVGMRPGLAEDDSQGLRVDGKESQVEGSMVERAEDQTISRIVGTVRTLPAEMGRVEQLDDVQTADNTSRAVALQDTEFKPLLSLSDHDLALAPRPFIDESERFLFVRREDARDGWPFLETH